MSHMANLIVRADKEVYLATNYWINSVASSYITNAMKELSRRAGERGTKIVMKMIYDRGSPKQLIEPHYFVGEKEYLAKAVNLPKPEEIPNIDLQVMNFHRPMLGTFHCKYMVVDRKYAVLQSNNIQDNDNVEMMIHLEGPIVDSMYDMALISWDKKLDPPLPSLNSPAAQGGLATFGEKSYQDMFGPNGSQSGYSATMDSNQRRAYEHEHREVNQPGVIRPQAMDNTADNNRADALTGPSTTESVLHPVGNQKSDNANVDDVTRGIDQQNLGDSTHPTTGMGQKFAEAGMIPKAQQGSRDVAPAVPKETPVEMHKEREESATLTGTNNMQAAQGYTHPGGPDQATQEFLGAGEQSIPASQIQHPSSADDHIPENMPEDQHYDVDVAGEVARVQTAVSPKPGETRMEAITRHLNHTTNKGFKGTAPDYAPGEEMTPYIPHPVHEPFPIAMVNREPYGPPNHHSVYNPQNEVWLSALRNAKKNVFIQTPTLNAEPLVPAIIEACERGIDIYCYICLGYNDTVSTQFLISITFQP
jgi:phosphatidylserine/phosphatidylglycerophosphate/cardiolipin synthase-like enzyme